MKNILLALAAALLFLFVHNSDVATQERAEGVIVIDGTICYNADGWVQWGDPLPYGTSVPVLLYSTEGLSIPFPEGEWMLVAVGLDKGESCWVTADAVQVQDNSVPSTEEVIPPVSEEGVTVEETATAEDTAEEVPVFEESDIAYDDTAHSEEADTFEEETVLQNEPPATATENSSEAPVIVTGLPRTGSGDAVESEDGITMLFGQPQLEVSTRTFVWGVAMLFLSFFLVGFLFIAVPGFINGYRDHKEGIHGTGASRLVRTVCEATDWTMIGTWLAITWFAGLVWRVVVASWRALVWTLWLILGIGWWLYERASDQHQRKDNRRVKMS